MGTIERHPAEARTGIAFSIRTNPLGRILVQDRVRFAPPGAAAPERLAAAKPSTRLELCQRLERTRDHLHRNLGRLVSLDELASIASLSPFHLARHFKLAFGVSPIAYHRMIRLEHAARLLAAGAVSVAEAADRTGYSDAVAFTHAFRKHFGQAPRRWATRSR